MTRLEHSARWLLLAPILLPLVVWQGLIYPYLVPKTLFFYTVSLITFAVFVLLVTQGRHFYWSRLARVEAWLPALLLALAYATSLVGLDFYRSFWSLLVRGDGLLMMSCVTASFYLMLLTVDKDMWNQLLRGVAGVASAVALYGVGEWLMAGGRIGGLLGNAAFFAGYLGLAFFVTLFAARTLHGGWRRAAYGGTVLELVATVLSATRGTLLALLVAGVAYLCYEAMVGEGKGRRTARQVLLGFVVALALGVGFRSQLANVPFAPIARLASVSIADPDIANRLFTWQHMLVEVGKSPWVGVGAEHIDALFNRFYDPSAITEQWFDRSHNAFLDYAAQYGVGGLLLYLALIASFFTIALRLWRAHDRVTGVLLALFALTYAIQNFFVFDTVSSLWLVYALLALSIARACGDIETEVLPLPRGARAAGILIATLLVVLIYPTVIQPARAASMLASAYLYQLTDVSREIDYLARGAALGTYANQEYGYTAYDMYTTTQFGRLTGEPLVNAYQATLALLVRNFERYPYDARTALYVAHMLSLAPAGESIDSNLLSGALERAIRLSPKRSQSWYVLANVALASANTHPPQSPERAAGYAAAEDIIRRYLATVPDLAMPHYVLAQLLLASGDQAAAAAEAALGKDRYRGDFETASRAVGYYESVMDLTNAATFLSDIVAMDPTNTAAREDLARIRAYEQSQR